MINGRVIGSELRDVPPERLAIWGQRWTKPRRALGPSEFSCHEFRVDGSTEAPPALVTPTTFLLTITEDDDDGDEDSSSSQFPSPFPFSPQSARSYSAELMQSDFPSSSLQMYPSPIHGQLSAPTIPASLGQVDHALHLNDAHSNPSQSMLHSGAVRLSRHHSVPGSHFTSRQGLHPIAPRQPSSSPRGAQASQQYSIAPPRSFSTGHLQVPQFTSPHHTPLQMPMVHSDQSTQLFAQPSPQYAPAPTRDPLLQYLHADNQVMSLPAPTTSTPNQHSYSSPPQTVGSASSWNNHTRGILAIEQSLASGSILRIPPENAIMGWPFPAPSSHPAFQEALPTQASASTSSDPDRDYWDLITGPYRNPSPLEAPLCTFTQPQIEGSILFDCGQSYNRMQSSGPLNDNGHPAW
ncbi:hypothetical protein HYDPIDRAFT_23088 [Hydnomerulius pinastri MD-312]|nr:hypothetical protein HYDPIDRAFT_23088 [Hydnomerulius pinastri MD-312]